MPDIHADIYFDEELDQWVGKVTEADGKQRDLLYCADERSDVVMTSVGTFLLNYGKSSE